LETIPSPSGACASAGEPPAPRTLDALVGQLLAAEDHAARQSLLKRSLARFDHNTLLTHLKDESERLRAADAQAALLLADLLIAAATLADRPDHHALGLMARGDAVRAQGRFAEAIDDLDAAAAAFLSLGDRVGWARTRLGWLIASCHQGRGVEALQVVDEAREVLRTGGMPMRIGILELNAGVVCWYLGRQQQALDHYQRAQQSFLALGEVAEEQLAWAKANTAVALTELGDFQTALRLHEEVRAIWERRGAHLLVAKQDHNIAYVNMGQGHFTRALRSLRAEYAAQQQAGFPIEAAWAALRMAYCYLRLNLFDQAIEYAEWAIVTLERSGTTVETARARLLCALACARDGDEPRALRLLDQAAATFAEADLLSDLAQCQLERAVLSGAVGEWHAALAAAAEARTSFAERGMVIRRAEADLVRARAATHLGDFAEAETFAGLALEIAQDHEVAWLLPEGHAALGAIARSRGDSVAALAEYERAIASTENLQRLLALDLRINYLADKQQHYDAALSLCLELGEPERAFTYLERAKSRSLVEYLANNLDVQIRARSNVAPQLLASLHALRTEHAWFTNQLYGDPLTNSEESPPAEHDDVRAALRDRERQIAHITEQLALDRTEGLLLSSTADADYLQPWHDLDPGTALVEYALTSEGCLAFVIADGRLHAAPLAISDKELRQLLRSWQLNLSACAHAILNGTGLTSLSRNTLAILRALHRALIAPIATYLADCARLIVVPFGITHTVPFHALHDGNRYLIECCEVVTCPSSALFHLCRARARRVGGTGAVPSALVVAHSAQGALPFVHEEARTVSALLPGELLVEAAATREAFTTAAHRHPIVHLAAHGEARLDNPAFAHLLLADGPLNTVDVFNLDLRGALVVLSACESGRVTVKGGDELIGLSRGFFYAGATTLIQSLWRVEDRSTAQMMADFYGALRLGATIGAALRDAQLALLRGDSPHPYYWAPFQLSGDNGAL
jgi:CHAT domain-containing protein